MENFGKKLKSIRKIKNMSQSQLAQKIAVRKSTVSNWECGRGMPDIGLLVPLSETLGVTVGELLDAKEKHQKQAKKETVLIFVFGFFLIFVLECFFYFFEIEVNQFVRIYVIGLVLLVCCLWGHRIEGKK